MDVPRSAAIDEAVPGPAVTAALLALARVRSVVVGSVALRLRDAHLAAPSDLDIVPEPGEPNLRAVVEALPMIGTPAWAVPSRAWLSMSALVSVPTFFGRLDLMLERAREEYVSLASSASVVSVLEVPVLVASLDDAMALRRRFKACDA